MKALSSLLAEISQASFPFEVHTLLEPDVCYLSVNVKVMAVFLQCAS